MICWAEALSNRCRSRTQQTTRAREQEYCRVLDGESQEGNYMVETTRSFFLFGLELPPCHDIAATVHASAATAQKIILLSKEVQV